MIKKLVLTLLLAMLLTACFIKVFVYTVELVMKDVRDWQAGNICIEEQISLGVERKDIRRTQDWCVVD